MDMYILIYLKWLINKDLLYSTWNSAQCYMAAWMGGELGREWIHIYVWLSPFTFHLKLTKLLISYTPIQNKKFQRKDYSESDISIVKNEIDICHNKCQNYVVIVIWSNTIL